MSYLAVNDFKFGMDRRRNRVTGVPGTLWVLRNAHISRGGDVERSKRFVPTYDLPVGTFGMGGVRGQLYVFGSADLSASMPPGVEYQRLQAPSGAPMVAILDVRGFDGKLYAVAEYADGNVHHFFNGSRVTDWDTIVTSATDFPTLAAYLADKISGDPTVIAISSGAVITMTAREPGAAFTLTKSTVNGGAVNDQDITFATVQPNVPAVAEVRATTTVAVTSGSATPAGSIDALTIDGVSVIAAAVPWRKSNESTAVRLASSINAGSTVHGYNAVVVGSTVTISAAAGLGSAANGRLVAVTTSGSATVSFAAALTGGVDAVDAIAQISTATLSGTFEAADRFTIGVNGTNYTATGSAAATGLSGFVFKKRIWQCAGYLWRYPKLSDPTNWTDASASTGAGFINVSNETEGTERLTGAVEYDGVAALFSRKSIRFINLDTDAENTALSKSIPNTGSYAPRGLLSYSNTDVFYLDPSGIRSLRARDASNVPTSDDIGTAIDPFIQTHIGNLTDAQVARAVATIEPRDRRYMLALGGYIFVLSNYPRSKITAWSYYDPGFTVSDFTVIDRRLYVRGGDSIYLYGGLSGGIYPNSGESVATLQTPFMAAEKLATMKVLKGFDAGVVNTWNTRVLIDPADETKYVSIGNIHRTTYGEPNIALPGRTTHLAVEMECSSAGFASISNLALHYDTDEAN